jgi:hypothetical protein
MSIDLKQLVIDDIDKLGYDAAAEKYGVHRNTIVNWMKGKASPGYEALQLAYNQHQGTCTVRQELAIWEGRKLILAMPVHRTIEAGCAHTIIANFGMFGATKCGFITTRGITLLEDARNTLVENFLSTGAERILFVDDDMILPCGSAPIFNGFYGIDVPEKFASRVLISELWNADKDIVGALYFGRNKGGVAQYSEAFQSKEEDKRAHNLDFDGLQETKWVGTGAMMVKREVFLKMKEMAPALWPNIIPRQPGLPHGFFNRLNADAGEDVSFCYRARECGFQVYVHKGVIAGHEGHMIFGPHNTAGRA